MKPLLTILILLIAPVAISCSNEYDSPDVAMPPVDYSKPIVFTNCEEFKYDISGYPQRIQDTMMAHVRYQQVTPDTIKVRILYDDGGAVPISRNAWHVYAKDGVSRKGLSKAEWEAQTHAQLPKSVFLEQNKRTRIDPKRVWQFRVYEWR